MRRIYYFTRGQRKGMALLLVMFIAFGSLVLLTTLLASLAPRNSTVVGEIQSDRALAVADGRIDLLMSTINTLPPVSVPDGSTDSNTIQAKIVAAWEGMLNGYLNDPNAVSNATSVSTCFYDTATGAWYAVWDTSVNPSHMMSLPAGTKLGRELGSGTTDTTSTVLALPLKNLSDSNINAGALMDIDEDCLTNNQWFEVDSNAVYNLDPTDVWTIKVSAYMLSKPDVVRTLEAKAEKNVDITPAAHNSTATTNVYNWFYEVTRYANFSDYVFLDNFDVNFGKYAEINGAVHANGTVRMGGWGKFPISSTETVTAEAVDDGKALDGRFGPDKKDLTWAKANTDGLGKYYVKNGAQAVDWLNVDGSLAGMKNTATTPYNVLGNATLTFSVEGTPPVGKVTINNTKYDLPASGVIYVNGTATVKGTVLGSCVVGASGNINIAGDILYTTLPRTKESDAFTTTHDFLGLVSNQNVVIPYATFTADKNLEIDAAMVADGWLGTDPNDWQWHDLNTDPTTAPTLVLKGSMAAGSGLHMLATTQVDRRWVTSGYEETRSVWKKVGKKWQWVTEKVWVDTSGYVDFPQIKGYDLRQYNFDWNLKQLGVPALFPVNNSGAMGTEEQGLTPQEATALGLAHGELHPKSSPIGKYYAKLTSSSTVVTGTTYSGTGLVSGGVYRIGWKEQIGAPVDLAP